MGPEDQRIVLLHGFTQTSRCWGVVGEALSQQHEVIALDAPGHGTAADIRTDLDETAGLIAASGGPATYIGYSMGARMALHVALRYPDVVHRLVLIGGTPGIEDDSGRAARRERDLAMAQEIRDIGVEAFIPRWLAQPMFATLPPAARFEDERLRNTAEGLASSLELAGTGSQRPLWTELGQLRMPVLVVAGANDERYADIAERMVNIIGPNAQLAVIPEAGHTAHLEQPKAFLRLLEG